jgi:peptidoglycan/LPS O-acetylase OafA/YrhL
MTPAAPSAVAQANPAVPAAPANTVAPATPANPVASANLATLASTADVATPTTSADVATLAIPANVAPPASVATHRLRRLDGLRGLAILLVMVVHFWRPEEATALGRWMTRVAAAGWSGVDLFFVLSGFLITGILADTRGRPGWLRNFFARRVLRIFPLYYLFLAVSMLLLPAYVARIHFTRVPDYGYAADVAAWPWYASYTSNLWMALHGRFSPGGANSLTWSLAVEEQFYLAWPLLILLCPPRRLLALVGALFAAAVAVRTGLVLAGSGWLPIFLLLPCRMDALAAGALAALYLRSPRFRPRVWQRLGSAACFILLPAAVLWILRPAGDVRETAPFQVAGYSLLALGFAGLLAKVLDGGTVLRRAFDAAPLVSLGKYSYGIYLFHVVLFSAVLPLAYKPVLAWLGSKLLERWFWLFAGIAGSWLLAAALYHLFEVHFLRLKRSFGGAAAEAPAAAAPPLSGLAVTGEG